MSSTPFAKGTESEASDSTPVDEQALAGLLSEYIDGPVPGSVMGTFDGKQIELTDENLQSIAEAATAAGRGLTVKGKRRQHYMTFTPPHLCGLRALPQRPLPVSLAHCPFRLLLLLLLLQFVMTDQLLLLLLLFALPTQLVLASANAHTSVASV
jgi:hypothetical protein